tara:strand:- start:42 stop:710 length:669 start_codon:yes stop_codon:yes gene_type:complete
MRRSAVTEEYRTYLDMPEQKASAEDRFTKFCQRATAKNKEWDDFGGTDTYKLVQLLSPGFDDKKRDQAINTYNRKNPPLDKDGQIYHLNVALKKLFIASLHFETPECDAGGMPTSGDSVKTKFLNKRLDRMISELKELQESTTEEGIGQKLEESLTENAKLRMRLDKEEQDSDALEQECKRLAKLLENKDTMIETMVKKSQYDMVVSENKSLTKTLNNLGIK